MVPKVIEFVSDWYAEVESTTGRLRQVAFRRGESFLAVIHAAEGGKGQPAMADLRMVDGTKLRHVPLSQFSVVDSLARVA